MGCELKAWQATHQLTPPEHGNVIIPSFLWNFCFYHRYLVRLLYVCTYVCQRKTRDGQQTAKTEKIASTSRPIKRKKEREEDKLWCVDYNFAGIPIVHSIPFVFYPFGEGEATAAILHGYGILIYFSRYLFLSFSVSPVVRISQKGWSLEFKGNRDKRGRKRKIWWDQRETEKTQES